MKQTLMVALLTMLLLSAWGGLPVAAWEAPYGNSTDSCFAQQNYSGNCVSYNDNWNWGWSWGRGWCPPPSPPPNGGGCCRPPCDRPGCPEVPEPGSLALLGGGLATFVSWVGIRRRKTLAK